MYKITKAAIVNAIIMASSSTGHMMINILIPAAEVTSEVGESMNKYVLDYRHIREEVQFCATYFPYLIVIICRASYLRDFER